LDQAISDCNMALKNLNQCAQSIKRNRESKMDTLTLTDPFADDSKDTAARKQSESIVATAVQVAFKESQWGIAWKMNACFERLGSLHMTRGSWRDAQYYFDQGRLLGEQLKSDAMKYHFMLSLSDAYLRCADLNHCASQLEEASNIQPHGFAYIREEADLKMANGELDAIRNYLDQAIESYDRADELFQKLTDSGYIATLENLIER
ncbi:uncharacterized protein BYT42DRAFT_498607, partial [Radiomyces spectabilis]|uniref:uncharacterized protein n=1 Tax=Radiomyces spectabilis TaxID=64574 RepID=UPI002221296A